MSASSFAGLYAVCGSFIGLSTITVSLRFYSRARKALSFGIDDYAALLGTITFIAAAACMLRVSVLGGAGYSHGGDLSVSRSKTIIQLTIAFDFMQMNTLACAKLSALFLYRRVFSVDRYSWFRWVFWGTIIVIGMWYITWDVLSCVQCPRFSDYWETTNFVEVCNLNLVWANGLAVTDLILDLWVMVIPIPFIWNLHATLARKAAIMGIFLLAFIGLGASIARVIFFFRFDAPGRQVVWVGLLESGMTITVVNLPSIWWLFSSKVPEKLDRSLHSLRSLGSCSNGGGSKTEVEPEAPCRAVRFAGQSDSNAKSHGGDVEAGYNGRKGSNGLNPLAPDVIEVERKVEVESAVESA